MSGTGFDCANAIVLRRIVRWAGDGVVSFVRFSRRCTPLPALQVHQQSAALRKARTVLATVSSNLCSPGSKLG
jgi:hypothetical protein